MNDDKIVAQMTNFTQQLLLKKASKAKLQNILLLVLV
jgi:hypothetical protein